MNPTPEPDTGEAEQLCLTPAADPDRLITEAKLRWSPIRTYCLFSGGSDSTVLAHRCHPHYDALCYVDTGTAAEEGPGGPSVLAHVQGVAAWLEKPLVVIAAGDAYRMMVLGGQLIRRGSLAGTPERGHGFPGPGQHGKAYSRLKERQLEELVRRAKRGHPRGASVLLLSGVRRAESQRRAKRMPLTERGSRKFVNPLIDWSNQTVERYRRTNQLPQSDVSALLHRSGECNCGAYASAEDERAMLSSLFPRTWGRIAQLEAEAQARGIRWCRWGGYDLAGNRATDISRERVGELCQSCQQASLFRRAA